MVDDVEGHAADASLLRPAHVGQHLLGRGVAQQQIAQGVPVQPGGLGHLQQHIQVADVAALLEVGRVDRVDHSLLGAVRRQRDQPVREQGVGRAGDRIEIEVQPYPRAGLARPGEQLIQRRAVADLGLHGGTEVLAARRDAFVEKEGAIAHLHRRAVPMRQRELQVSFADATPGTNGVLKEIDLHGTSVEKERWIRPLADDRALVRGSLPIS